MDAKANTAEAERILTTEYEKFYRLAYSYVQNKEDALDVVQESAYKVIRDCGRVRQAKYLSTWIYRVVINTSLDLLRRRSRESAAEVLPEIPSEECYGEMELRQVLGCLDEKSRAVQILRYFEDMKLEDIAGVLEENTSTVKARLYRSLKKLRACLSDGSAPISVPQKGVNL